MDRLLPREDYSADREARPGCLVTSPAIGDWILTEVLQGLPDERDFHKARKMLTGLRVAGITARKTADTVIATPCIKSGYEL